MSNLQNAASRFKELEASASELKRLLQTQRMREDPQFSGSGNLFSLGGYSSRPSPALEPLTPEEEESKKERERVAEIRRAAAARGIEEKYQPLQTAIATHIQGLTSFKSDIESMNKDEGRRSFWKGVWVNAFFFVLGSAVSAISLSTTQVVAFLGMK